MNNFIIQPLAEPELAYKAAAFFATHIEATYISHGDIIDDRALDTATWSPDIEKIFAIDALAAAGNATNLLADGLHLTTTCMRGEMAGIMLYEFVTGRRSRIALLHDIVVAKSLRGQGIGSAMLAWLEAQTRQADDIGKLFLESGLENHAAHTFFEHRDYQMCSKTMIKHFNPSRIQVRSDGFL